MYSNLVSLIRDRVFEDPLRVQFTFADDTESEETNMTRFELDRKVRTIASALQEKARPGDRVLLMHFSDVDFVLSFLACLYAGVIAVPVYLPDIRRMNRMLPIFAAIVRDCDAGLATTTSEIMELARMSAVFDAIPTSLEFICVDQLDPEGAEGWTMPSLDDDTIAFLQYTSGSTGIPKGVVNRYGNILQNLSVIESKFQTIEDMVTLSWLPMYHDMGLIGHLLHPVYVGYQGVLMKTEAFVSKPARWLKLISHYGASLSGGPCFAYSLCNKLVVPERLTDVDLSGWKTAYCGAEPIQPEVLEQFSQKFEPFGFQRDAFFPCYGMAEATLFISGGRSLETFRFRESKSNSRRGIIPFGEESSRMVVNCGTVASGHFIKAVDPDTLREVDESKEGELWFSGPSVAAGYWNNPDNSAAQFEAKLAGNGDMRFLRTGDLGFIRDNFICVTGRLKDLLIINGRNYHPADIEHSIERCGEKLRPNSCACFSFENGNVEKLCVIQEIGRHERKRFSTVIHNIRRTVQQEHGLVPGMVALVPSGTLLKTSSGKLSRSRCRKCLWDGTLEVIAMWKDTTQSEDNRSELYSVEEKERVFSELIQLLQSAYPSKFENSITLNTAPIYDLGMDSVEVVGTLCSVNERFGIHIDYRRLFVEREDSDGFTMNDICTLVLEQISARKDDKRAVGQ